ncbi:hypothetical protein DQ244_14635 [Blastococcus sp. TBT05-19]|uniref:hypothetical protein n=1 Tax=Blastococcus sp. TBT05-19 TaxID=2250581 RepID=UPI000DE868B1|nr:hypothetical protein [Blastococcus sp. TBT05-19]RBY89009.1 hypothetical protein DQ244_14635 [Blastococcus sp. TBT05-19]
MHTSTSTTIRRWAAGGATAVLLAALPACGSDGGTDEAGGESPASTSAAGDVEAFCAAAVEAESMASQGPAVDFETASPEEIQAAVTEFGARLEPSLKEVEDTAPDEVRDDVETLTGMIRQMLETGDDTLMDSEEARSADAGIDDYMLDSCGYEQIEATAVDYEFEGIPDTVPGGTVAVTFANEGEEMHEIGIARINDGVTASAEELLAMPEEQAMTMATFTGGAFAPPGGSDTTFLELQPGRYAAICFVPQGTTDMETMAEGAPHFTLGMVSEFTVE